MPNMPAWGGKDRKIGNNPLIMAIPRSSGKHAVIDCAVSQFSYGKIEEAEAEGPAASGVPGGYDTNGNITTDPAEIERHGECFRWATGREAESRLPWITVATVLTSENSVKKIGTFGDEVGIPGDDRHGSV